ncbi:MAG TPA: hypothetical protein VIF64_16645, partial [Pyrinomonadaceae bacterium]
MFRSQGNRFAFLPIKCLLGRVVLLVFICTLTGASEAAQTEPPAQTSLSPQTTSPTPSPTPAVDRNESERSDRLTGGHIELADLEPDQPDIRITLNVPSFRLT